VTRALLFVVLSLMVGAGPTSPEASARRLGGMPVLAAQDPAAPAIASTVAPTPRTADGRPDLNGVWGGSGQGAPNFVQKGDTLVVVFQLDGADPFEDKGLFAALDRRGSERKAAAPNKPPYKPELAARLKEASDLQSKLDPAFYCKPEGVPRMGAPSQIVQTPGQVVFLYEGRNTFRVIPTDGRPHRDDLEPTWNGDSVGRWEGDTLVVDVANIIDESWLGADGWFHSDALHVVERFRREGDTLTYSAIVEDPKMFTGPWVTTRTLRLNTDPAGALVESPPCIERSGVNQVTNDHH
jgi:hypothetical protein